MKWLYLALAIVFEVMATLSLKGSQSFTKLGPSLLVLLGYGLAFYFLSLTLKYLPIGIVYAIWSGCGVLLITLLGYLFFKQALDFPAVLGIFLIALGVIIINFFSKSTS